MKDQGFDRGHEDPTDGSLRRLAVEDSIAAAFRHIHNDLISWHHLENLIVTTLPDHAKVRVWLTDITKWRDDGNSEKLPFEFPKYKLLKNEIMIGLNERVNLCDPLTKIAAINYESKLWRQFGDLNPQIFLKKIIEYNGRLIQISGNPGSGKTDFALLLTEFALKENFVVITNILSSEALLIRFGEEVEKEGNVYRDNFYRTVRMSDLLYQCIRHIRDDRNVIIVWDEVSTFYNRSEAMKRENVDIGKLLRLIRKFNANILFLEQITDNLATIAREMLVAKFVKETRKRVHFMTLPGEGHYNEYLTSVPKARIHFKTGDFAGFMNDVDFGDMFNKIAIEEVEKLDVIEEYILKIINKNSKSGKLSKTMKKYHKETEVVRNKKGHIMAHRPIDK